MDNTSNYILDDQPMCAPGNRLVALQLAVEYTKNTTVRYPPTDVILLAEKFEKYLNGDS